MPPTEVGMGSGVVTARRSGGGLGARHRLSRRSCFVDSCNIRSRSCVERRLAAAMARCRRHRSRSDPLYGRALDLPVGRVWISFSSQLFVLSARSLPLDETRLSRPDLPSHRCRTETPF